jgi:hypothetical protein
MANFAKIENGVVTNIIVLEIETEADVQEHLATLGITGTWVAAFGRKEATLGDTYNSKTGEFKPAQPFASWKWSASEWSWQAPVPMPTDNVGYRWNEELLEWVEV